MRPIGQYWLHFATEKWRAAAKDKTRGNVSLQNREHSQRDKHKFFSKN